jgi:DNA polymerase-3 subunit delta
MLNKALERDIKSGLKSPIYYLWGEDPFLLEEALSRMVDILISDAPAEFNYDIFYPSASPSQIIDATSTLPFMAERRLVVLKDFHEFPEATIKELIPYLRDPSESTCMVILSGKAPRKGLDIKWRVYHLSIKDGDMPSWVRGLCSRKGVQMTEGAIGLLLEFTGHDTGLLSMEIEKLAHSGRKVIKEDDIISLVGMMRHFSSFELINCIFEGDRTKALRMLRAMFKEGNATDVATLLLGALNWRFRELYNLWLDKGRGAEGRYRGLRHRLSQYSGERFYSIFKALHEADTSIKTGVRPDLVMEILVIKLLMAMTGQEEAMIGS